MISLLHQELFKYLLMKWSEIILSTGPSLIWRSSVTSYNPWFHLYFGRSLRSPRPSMIEIQSLWAWPFGPRPLPSGQRPICCGLYDHAMNYMMSSFYFDLIIWWNQRILKYFFDRMDHWARNKSIIWSHINSYWSIFIGPIEW